MNHFLKVLGIFSLFAFSNLKVEEVSAQVPPPQTMVVRIIPNVAMDVAYYYDPYTFLNPTHLPALSYSVVPGFYGPQTFTNYWNGFHWYGYYYHFYQFYTAPIWVWPGYWSTAYYYIYHL